MIEFVNIENELSFQDRNGIPANDYGLIYARDSKPLPFQYRSSESVSSYVAKRVNHVGTVVEINTLSTDLINSDGTYHICDGLSDYASNLDCGLYYFLVNSKYQSEYFRVESNLTDGTDNQDNISVSGLEFFNNNYTIPWRKRIGKPDIFYGIQYAENSTPLYFDYLSSETVTSFKAVRVNNLGNDIEETDLNTSLISVTDHHICDAQTNYLANLDCGVYYYKINNKYESELFEVFDIDESMEGIGYDIIEDTLVVY